MRSLGSLAQLHNDAEKVFGRRLLLPVDEEFVQSVHSSAVAEKCAEHFDFSLLYKHLLDRNQRRKCSGRPPGVPKLLFSFAAGVVLGSREGEFMGPLCSPLRKSHAGMLRSSPYFLTEKSDGTRAVLVSFRVNTFPCWLLRGPESCVLDSLRLDDVAALEEMRQRLQRSVTPVSSSSAGSSDRSVQISSGLFHVECEEETLLGNTEVEKFILRPSSDLHSSTSTCTSIPFSSTATLDGNIIVAERRLDIRYMSYCFDRSMEQTYLVLDEYKTPSLSALAVDGEIMFAMDGTGGSSTLRLIFGCFDLFRYVQIHDGIHTDMCLTRWTMSARYDALKNLVISPIHDALHLRSEKPLMHLFAKEMYPLEKFAECLSRLRRSEILCEGRGGCDVVYYYDGPYGLTRSDGFIFTPEKFDLVHGASKEQLKWKWPSMLSVDWSLTAIAGRKDEYVVDAFFRKRRFGHRPDSVGHSRLFSAFRLLNPFSLVISSEKSVVVECVFDRQEKCWSIERLRTDKSEPNSIVTIISVLESLVEDITLDVLIDMLGVRDTVLDSYIQPLQEGEMVGNMTKEVKNIPTSEPFNGKGKTCQFTLRATQLQTQGEHEIYLYWAVRLLLEKQHIPCIHCKVSECAGLGFPCPIEDDASKLTEYLYIALANAGGSYAWSDFTVDAVFDGDSGRWNIVSLQPNGENRKSTCIGVIQHLNWLLVHGREKAHGIIISAANDQDIPRSSSSGSGLNMVHQPTVDLVEKTNIHYATKIKELSCGKSRSLLRQFNNWVKSVLISNAVSFLQLNHCKNSKHEDLAVADICCGRGGDLFKWRAHKPRYIFMVDSCLEAVAEAAARYSVSKGLSVKIVPQQKNDFRGILAYFTVCDVFDEKGALESKFHTFFNQYLKRDSLDIISCQFSIHYGCSSEERITYFLRAISSALHSGGVFIGTTVNDAELMHRVTERGSTFGNSMYSVTFPSEKTDDQSFGAEYCISVEESVSELPEYLVPWGRFVALCNSVGLQLEESLGFTEYSNLYYSSSIGQELRDAALGGGAKRDSDGHTLLRLPPEEMEAASLFRTFFFVKR